MSSSLSNLFWKSPKTSLSLIILAHIGWSLYIHHQTKACSFSNSPVPSTKEEKKEIPEDKYEYFDEEDDEEDDDEDDENEEDKEKDKELAKTIYDTLYKYSNRILDRESQVKSIDIICSTCDELIVSSPVFVCSQCPLGYICLDCESKIEHDEQHILVKIKAPLSEAQILPEAEALPIWPPLWNEPVSKYPMLKRTLTDSECSRIPGNLSRSAADCRGLFKLFVSIADTAITYDNPHESDPHNVTFTEVPDDFDQECWPGVGSETILKFFPTAVAPNKALQMFLLDIYHVGISTCQTGIIDFSAFVYAHEMILYSTEPRKLGYALFCIDRVKSKLDKSSPRKKTSNWHQTKINTPCETFCNMFRAIFYDYHELSKYLFADATNILAHQKRFEEERPKPLKTLYKVSDGAIPTKIYKDSRVDYNPVSDSFHMESMVDLNNQNYIEMIISTFKETMQEDFPRNYFDSNDFVEFGRQIPLSSPEIRSWITLCMESAII